MSIYEENPVLRILQSYGKITMDTFSDRLRLQKIAYLSQQLHSDGGFSFTYYHYGPYSPRLTKLLYRGVETGSFSKDVVLSGRETQTAKHIQELVGSNPDDPHLELFATVWYLLPIQKTTAAEQGEIIEMVAETKPRFSREAIRQAMGKILEFREHHGFS